MRRITDRHDLLRKACLNGDYDLVKFCIENSDINLKEDNTLIENASYYGYCDIVRLLIESGANPEGYGMTHAITKLRSHPKTHNLINLHMRKKKLNKIFNGTF